MATRISYLLNLTIYVISNRQWFFRALRRAQVNEPLNQAWETDSRYASPLSLADTLPRPSSAPLCQGGARIVCPEGARVPWPRVAVARGRYMCARSASVRAHLQMFLAGRPASFTAAGLFSAARRGFHRCRAGPASSASPAV